MAETGALGVFFWKFAEIHARNPWAGERRENLPQKLWLLYGLMLTPVFLFPLSQGSRVFVAAWGWKTPSHTVQLKTGGKFTAWNWFTSLKQLILCFQPQKVIWYQKNTLPNRLCLHSPVKQPTLALKKNLTPSHLDQPEWCRCYASPTRQCYDLPMQLRSFPPWSKRPHTRSNMSREGVDGAIGLPYF